MQDTLHCIISGVGHQDRLLKLKIKVYHGDKMAQWQTVINLQDHAIHGQRRITLELAALSSRSLIPNRVFWGLCSEHSVAWADIGGERNPSSPRGLRIPAECLTTEEWRPLVLFIDRIFS